MDKLRDSLKGGFTYEKMAHRVSQCSYLIHRRTHPGISERQSNGLAPCTAHDQRRPCDQRYFRPALIAWSPSGQYLAALTQQQKAIQVYDVKTAAGSAIPVLNTLFWGWTTDGQLYAIDDQKIDFYHLSGSTLKLVHSIRYTGMLSRAVSTPKGLLVGIGFGAQTVYLVSPNGMMQVTSKPVNAWWFDAKNDRLYEIPTGTSGRVFYMRGF